jgi:uncharacterized protein
MEMTWIPLEIPSDKKSFSLVCTVELFGIRRNPFPASKQRENAPAWENHIPIPIKFLDNSPGKPIFSNRNICDSMGSTTPHSRSCRPRPGKWSTATTAMKKNSMPSTGHILVISRYPVPGQAKTRLIPALGPARAARLHRRMTEQVLEAARKTRAAKKDLDITVCYTGASRQAFRAWMGSDLCYEQQPSGSLGVRLQLAFARAFANKSSGAIAVGTDVPGLSPDIFDQAFCGLRDRDIVIGPATDGGYYLIGMKNHHPGLFTDIDWGTERVLFQTLETIKRLGLTVETLPTLDDVDHPGDLPRLHDDPRFSDVFIGNPMLSVILPTLNEAGTLLATLQSVREDSDSEVIVADGGSRDTTREIAAMAGAIVLCVNGGRAAQMNAGAALARGRILLFLHADTHLPDGYANRIRAALDNPATVAGAFRFRTDGAGMAMRMIEWMVDFRSIVLQWPYGDQGLFLEKRVFAEMGGFPLLPVMEDFEFVRQLRHRGSVVTLPEAVITSARRWNRLGVIRTTAINQIMIAGFLCGVPLQSLKRLYAVREQSAQECLRNKKE